MIRSIQVTLVLLLLTVLSLNATAQDASTIEKVEQHFLKGAELFQGKSFDLAIKEFESGYALYPDPIFLYNISLAHGKMGRIEKSLAVAELAKSQNLGEPDGTQNGARVIALRSVLHGRSVSESVPKQVKPVGPPPGPAANMGLLGWVGVGTASVGTLALLGALVIDLTLSSDVESYEDAADRGDQDEYERLKEDISSQQQTAKVLIGTGTTMVIVGAGLIVWDVLSRDSDSDTQVGITPLPGGAAANLRMTF